MPNQDGQPTYIPPRGKPLPGEPRPTPAGPTPDKPANG